MSDTTTPIADLKKEMKQFVKERNWEKYHHPKEVAIALSIEASELLEIFQWDEKIPVDKLKKDEKTIQKIRDEIADVFLLTLDFANQLDIDITECTKEKMEKNRKKYDKEHILKTGAYKKDLL